MSEILLIYATRYGSTAQVSSLVAEHLLIKGIRVMMKDVRENPEVSGYDMVLLGSGIYAHRFLPEMEFFIADRREELLEVKLGVFGVAMRTEVVQREGRTFGGELIINRYSLNPAVKGMLHGRMDFSALSRRDRDGLERFYISIGLSEEEKEKKRELRDMISSDECTDFARRVLRVLG